MIDGSVSLNQPFLLRYFAIHAADHSQRNGAAVIAQRTPNRDNPFSQLQRIRIAEWDKRRNVSIHFKDRNIGERVCAYDSRIYAGAVIINHSNRTRTLDDVVVRDDVPVLRNDYTRTGCLTVPPNEFVPVPLMLVTTVTTAGSTLRTVSITSDVELTVIFWTTGG